MNTTGTSSARDETRLLHVFLTRGLIAIVWAAVFAAVADSLTAGVTLAAGVLLVAYLLIDVVGSLVDARSETGSERKLLLAGAATSALAAVALGVAATGSVADVLTVFGVWATLSGAAQLVVALRRGAALGSQWPLLLAGGVSVFGGLVFVIAAAVGTPTLSMLAIYAATGGVEFVIQAWLLARRRHRPIALAA